MREKIAFISEHSSPLATLGGVDSGGQNVYVNEVAKSLGEMGYSVDIFTRWDNARLPQIVDLYENVRLIHIKAGPKKQIPKEELLPLMDEFTMNMSLFVNRNKYHLIHAHFWMSGLVAMRIKEKFKTPFVITFHALGKIRKLHQKEADGFPECRIDIEKQLAASADTIIAECPQDKEDLLLYYNADPRRIDVVPCGVNTNELFPIDKNLAKMLLGLPENEKVILQLGRIVPRKGIETAIRGIAELKKNYKNPARLLIVGGESRNPDPKITPEIGRLQNIAKDLGVENSVTFVGSRQRHEIRNYFSAADVFVTTPWYEPFGMTPLEAMACGTPVIGSNVGGVKFSVVDGKTGYLIEPNDWKALAAKARDIFSDDGLSKELRDNSLNRIKTHFTWSGVTRSIAKVYDDIVAANYPHVYSNRKILERNFSTSIQTLQLSHEMLRSAVLEAANVMTERLKRGKKILVCGNGGSAADAQHFAAELVGRYVIKDRPGMPVIPLTVDTATLTAWANDFSFDTVFARQVEAFGKAQDILVGISTSGNSANVIEAFKKAKEKRITTIAFVGKTGGPVLELADIVIHVPAHETARIQEVHMTILHMMAEMIEKNLYAEYQMLREVDEQQTILSPRLFQLNRQKELY